MNKNRLQISERIHKSIIQWGRANCYRFRKDKWNRTGWRYVEKTVLREEFDKALDDLKSKRGAGINGIQAELWKESGKTWWMSYLNSLGRFTEHRFIQQHCKEKNYFHIKDNI